MWESIPAEAPSPAETPAHSLVSPPEEVEMSQQGEPLPNQPGLEIGERCVQIKAVGLFRRKTGQPVCLRAYPWIERPAVPPVEGKPQAYTGQDRHDPTGLYPCSTCRERQQSREAERRAATCQDVDDPAYNHWQALEHHKYAGKTLIWRRRQEPLSERILTNDLYGIPLYQPSMGLISRGQMTGARAAAAVTKTTGADPKFVTDRVIGRTTRPRWYEMAHRPEIDPGPMRYACRVHDCRAFGTDRFSFTTEEELVCHWNMFHVAVMPQFTCQHLGCGAVFAANPGSLDRYLPHIEQRRKEEADAGVPLTRRHSNEPN